MNSWYPGLFEAVKLWSLWSCHISGEPHTGWFPYSTWYSGIVWVIPGAASIPWRSYSLYISSIPIHMLQTYILLYYLNHLNNDRKLTPFNKAYKCCVRDVIILWWDIWYELWKLWKKLGKYIFGCMHHNYFNKLYFFAWKSIQIYTCTCICFAQTKSILQSGYFIGGEDFVTIKPTQGVRILYKKKLTYIKMSQIKTIIYLYSPSPLHWIWTALAAKLWLIYWLA